MRIHSKPTPHFFHFHDDGLHLTCGVVDGRGGGRLGGRGTRRHCCHCCCSFLSVLLVLLPEVAARWRFLVSSSFRFLASSCDVAICFFPSSFCSSRFCFFDKVVSTTWAVLCITTWASAHFASNFAAWFLASAAMWLNLSAYCPA